MFTRTILEKLDESSERDDYLNCKGKMSDKELIVRNIGRFICELGIDSVLGYSIGSCLGCFIGGIIVLYRKK